MTFGTTWTCVTSKVLPLQYIRVLGFSLKRFQTNFARQQFLRHGYVGDYHFVVRWPVSWAILRHCHNAHSLRLQRSCSTLPLIRFLHVYMHWIHWATGQNGRHFADDIFKCIFLNGNIWIAISNSLTFVSKGPINNIPALTQIMAWCRPGDKPLSEPKMLVYRRIYASLGLNELTSTTHGL